MRLLFAALLLANLLVIGWSAIFSQYPSRSEIRFAHEGPGLNLIREIPDGDSTLLLSSKDATGSESAPSDEGSTICLTLRGFSGEDDARVVWKELQGLGPELRFGYDSDQSTNYWVLIPPLESQEDATRAVTELRVKGLDDVYRVPEGRYANAISLGVFSSRDVAENRYRTVSKLTDKAAKPVLTTVQLPLRRYWIELPDVSRNHESIRGSVDDRRLSVSRAPCK